ncbi:MAG: PHP domain-containing protein [Oscillospiraceae bacterium]|nr:PHP domain-containing protein [Oscillospiraceae bacterium]
MKAYYDLHIHSCLSPCADNDMTPNNIANMAVLAGLDIIALTDHNSCKNCPALNDAAIRAGIAFVPGMELCTAEECHVICLFSTLKAAMEFDEFVERSLPPIQNHVEIFGEQLIMNNMDYVTASYPYMLASATSISIDNVAALVRQYGGVAIPAHIDRPSFSVTANLGTVPDFGFCVFESVSRNVDELVSKYPILEKHPLLFNSDAHMLSQIQDKGPWIEVEKCDAESFIAALELT